MIQFKRMNNADLHLLDPYRTHLAKTRFKQDILPDFTDLRTSKNN